MIRLDKLHCPSCRGTLRAFSPDYLVCQDCNEPVPVRDGVVDFVGGRFDTMLDPAHYDALQHIDDGRSEQKFQAMQRFAGERWPLAFGSVLEVGCGTGLFSRALIANGTARDAVLTDASAVMLAACRNHLDRLGLSARMPIVFATYTGQENAFRDAVFDTCAGTSVLHHMTDVRGFLGDLFRMLKPGGRAFFMEPNLRFHRALMHTLADILAQLQTRQDGFSQDRQKLHNVLSEARRMMLHQGDLAFLATLEDKHMFEADAFEQTGLELGFETVEALPTLTHPTGIGVISTLCHQLGVSDELRREVMKLMPAFSARYLRLLSPRDRSAVFLLWLEKGTGPRHRSFRGPSPDEEGQSLSEQPPDPAGGLPPHWSLGLVTHATEDGVSLHLSGWCLLNADVRWLRVTLDGVARDTPVWQPRPDVQDVINGAGLYPTWAALCSGLDVELPFEGVMATTDGMALAIEVILVDGTVLPVPAPERLGIGEEISVGA